MEYTFVVTEQEANLIAGALAELPVKVSLNLINKLQKQASEQQPEKAEQAE